MTKARRRMLAQEPCPRCGQSPVGGEDFQSGIYAWNGSHVRRHSARYTLRCLNPACRYTATVWDLPRSDRP